MVKILLLALTLNLSLHAAAVERTPYATEAAQEMDFYFRFLNGEVSFLSTLTDLEKSQFNEMAKITRQLTATQGIQLKYSVNSADFILHEGEPERSAKTTEILEDPIWINLNLLNSAKKEVQFLDLVQILVHELGHKLGPAKNQNAVDAVAAKMVTHLSQYSRKDHVYWDANDGRREMREHFISLALPKAVSERFADPTLFYVDDQGVYKIDTYFQDRFLNPDGNRIIQLERLSSKSVQNTYLDAYFSVFRVFQTPAGLELVHENSYHMESFFFISDRRISQQPFQNAKIVWRRPSLNFDFVVTGIQETSRTMSEISWEVEFTGKPNPESVQILVGADSQDVPSPCTVLTTNKTSTSVRCTYNIPKVTSIFYELDVSQMLVDGEVADLPEILKIRLQEDFKVKFAYSDQRAKSFNKVETVDGPRYELEMESEFDYEFMIIRCAEIKPYISNGLVLGNIETTQEYFFSKENLPVKSQRGKNWVFSVACPHADPQPLAILATDATGYTASPRWDRTRR